MKKLITVLSLVLTTAAFASHPHNVICTVTTKSASLESIQFLLQIQSERQYVEGDPNKDIHDFTYQARICDDDNDLSAAVCSTFETLKPTHSSSEEFSLVNMINKKDVFFKGKIINNNLTGNIGFKDYVDGVTVRKVETITAKLNCINQTWVKLEAVADSNVY